MGSALENGRGFPMGAGWQRRISLGTLMVRHLLPLWHSKYPQDQGPEKMLLLAEQVRDGKQDRDAASEESDTYWSVLSDLGTIEDDTESAETLPFLVGCAAARVVRTACVESQMVLPFDPTELDTDRDVWMWDESYIGARASAGGSVWVASSSPVRRREFWQWWLEQAVPQTYHSVSD